MLVPYKRLHTAHFRSGIYASATKFIATDMAWARWLIARSDDERRARLNIIKHVLANIPCDMPWTRGSYPSDALRPRIK